MRALPGTIAFAGCLAAGCGSSAPATSTGGAGQAGGGGQDADGSAGTGGRGAPSDGSVAVPPARWVMGYYAGYQASLYPVDQIPWSSLTHVAVAFYLPRSDGTLDESLDIDATNGPALARSLVAAAHASGRLALASIGGAGLHDAFAAAAAAGPRATFVANLIGLLSTYGYDGLDLDWEPVATADQAPLQALVAALRAAAPPGTLLSMPVGYENVNLPDDLSIYAAMAADLDRINIMTYGMAGAYDGWKSWHSSALYQTDSATPTSIDSSVKLYLKAGVPAAKLGIGSGFYGLCYTPPVAAPDQALGGATLAGDDGTLSYANLAAAYDLSTAHRDTAAQVPYLSFAAATGPQGCCYVSYEDPQSLADKGAYLKGQALGGVIIWTINEGYLPTAPTGQRSPLLTALGAAVLP